MILLIQFQNIHSKRNMEINSFLIDNFVLLSAHSNLARAIWGTAILFYNKVNHWWRDDYVIKRLNVPFRLSAHWLYSNSQTWVYDVRLYIAGIQEPESVQIAISNEQKVNPKSLLITNLYFTRCSCNFWVDDPRRLSI